MDLEFEKGKIVRESQNYVLIELLRKGLFIGHLSLDKDVCLDEIKHIKLTN